MTRLTCNRVRLKAYQLKQETESVSCSVIFNSLQTHGLQPTRLLCPWNFSGKNTGVGSHSLLQRIFPTQGQDLGLQHRRQILYRLSHQGSPSQQTMMTVGIPGSESSALPLPGAQVQSLVGDLRSGKPWHSQKQNSKFFLKRFVSLEENYQDLIFLSLSSTYI